MRPSARIMALQYSYSSSAQCGPYEYEYGCRILVVPYMYVLVTRQSRRSYRTPSLAVLGVPCAARNVTFPWSFFKNQIVHLEQHPTLATLAHLSRCYHRRISPGRRWVFHLPARAARSEIFPVFSY
jgi:hypothetical protein